MMREPWGPFMTRWCARLSGSVVLGLSACGGTPAPVVPAVCEQPTPAKVSSFAQCGPSLDFTPINSYRGEFADLQDAEDAVVMINGGCTGTLIEALAGPVVLTAGHCVGLGDRSFVVFNFEDEPDGDPLMTDGTVIEQALEPDYALIQLDVLPQVAPLKLTTRASERLAIIQHPRGRRKVIAEGRYVDSCNQLVYYSDLDTLVGSSGAGVLNRQGHVLGIHTDGDCDAKDSSTNRGWTAEVIVEASPHLQAADIADR
ncbi:trypsin-like peptidase domain-containing protein [Myxococcus llanfairpwllgwyngyllgogerychwyrndrobwllllantysiliogogogochensis]|uniref:Trypsin-like peptidase domain-containing protein n=2 Tax=Myxococcaceae TaxID=31 RepID=A0A540X007_9BACT|nr:trypsin-like peptidase domain-containing protein [Myxococcus sp. CA056]TQF14598.1 trypsin-like peptidase domain-containing protein [Myxococcus llanfairpwllgwyngyllgogerychwyrndrobwllllantysiliogogogochensis]